MNSRFHRGELPMNPAPKLLLRLFGSPCIIGAGRGPLAGRPVQRHRLALLALLTRAPGARLSREKLMAYLWPESDTEHARSLLNQAVYVLRKALGESAIVTAGDELQLDDRVVRVDVADFEAALARGDWPHAVALCRGPFLDGFFLNGAPEFEHWLELERARLTGEYARALEAVAEQGEREQDFRRAAEWWRARAVLDPCDSRVALRLMEALAATGNPAGALRHAAFHQKALQAEFGLDPSPEVQELAVRLTREPSPSAVRITFLRVIAPQRPPPAAEPERSHEPTFEAAAGSTRSPPGLPPRIGYGVVALTAGAAVFGALWLLPPRDPAPAPAARNPSIAVLPLTVTDPGDTRLAHAMSEELIAVLAKTGLRVIASTSAFAFREQRIDVREIADSLKVETMLEGALHRSGSRLRVHLRLVDGRDGTTRWAETYDRELRDLFAVQEEVAREVARELGLRLGANVGARLRRQPTQNAAAYELYLRGWDPVLLRSDSGALRRLEYFRQAIALDPTFAAAHAGLAAAYLRIQGNTDVDGSLQELHRLAEEAVLRALALDDSLAEAHREYGLVRLRGRDHAGAESQFKRALALDPTDSFTREALVELYLLTGRPTAALADAGRALELDPLSPSLNAALARALLANGRCEEALEQLEKIAAVQPPLLRVPLIAAQCHALLGRLPEAIAVLQPHAGPRARGLMGYLLARSGRREEALRIRTELLGGWRRRSHGAVNVAMVYAGLGELDEAFLWLDRAAEDGSLVPIWGYGHVLEPIFTELHGDPRFERVKEALGL